jgi:hypothetical protein
MHAAGDVLDGNGIDKGKEPERIVVTRRKADEHQYDKKLLECALPVLTAVTLDDSSLTKNEVAEFASLAKSMGFKEKFDQELADAIVLLGTDHANNAKEVKSKLMKQCFMLTKDPTTPGWREALLDLVLAQATKWADGNAAAASYSDGTSAIIDDDLKMHKKLPDDSYRQLQAVAAVWKTKILWFKYDGNTDPDDAQMEAAAECKNCVSAVRETLKYGQKLWKYVDDERYKTR